MTPLLLALLPALSPGCAAPPTPDDGALPGLALEPYAPGLDAAEVAAAMADALAPGLPEPFTPLHTYQRAFDALGDADCPVGAPYEVPGDYVGCTASSGAYFWGPILYAEGEDPLAPAEFSVIGDGYIIDPEGEWLHAGGELAFQPTPGRQAGEPLEWFYLVSGTWGYAPEGGWTGARWSGVMHGDGQLFDPESWVLRLHGSLSREGRHLYLDELLMDAAHCGVNVVGAVRLRDPGGGWYVLTPEGCQGCGALVFEGGGEPVAMGEVCLDLSAPARALAATVWAFGQ